MARDREETKAPDALDEALANPTEKQPKECAANVKRNRLGQPIATPDVDEKLSTAAHREWMSLSTREKSQLTADRLCKGPRRYLCVLQARNAKGELYVDPAFPSLEVNANSVEEAEARFLKLLGVTNTNGVPKAEKISGTDESRRGSDELSLALSGV